MTNLQNLTHTTQECKRAVPFHARMKDGHLCPIPSRRRPAPAVNRGRQRFGGYAGCSKDLSLVRFDRKRAELIDEALIVNHASPTN
jgi:hypothetical protein